MNPLRFRTRTDLVEYVRKHAPLSSVRRAVNEGTLKACGGFSKLPPFADPGWVIEVTSRHGRTWSAAIVVDQIGHHYFVAILDRTPWEFWDGKVNRNHPVYEGDHPDIYQMYKYEAITHVQNTRRSPAPSEGREGPGRE